MSDEISHAEAAAYVPSSEPSSEPAKDYSADVVKDIARKGLGRDPAQRGYRRGRLR